MSHFCVLVFHREDESLEKVLQPWHEFECTGTDDEYVRDYDVTAERRGEWQKDTSTMHRGPNGELVSAYDDCFYRDPTEEEKEKAGPMVGTGCGGGVIYTSKDWGDGLGYRAKVHFLPEGWTEERIPEPQVRSFRDWLSGYYDVERFVSLNEYNSPFGFAPDEKGKHSYAVVDAAGEVVKVVDRTNKACWSWRDADGREVTRTYGKEELPKGLRSRAEELKRYHVSGAEWDWWVVGGRYGGRLRLKWGACGERGDDTTLYAKPHAFGKFDVARLGDLDLPAMEAAQKEAVEDSYRRAFERARENCRLWLAEQHENGKDAFEGADWLLCSGAWDRWLERVAATCTATKTARAWAKETGKGFPREDELLKEVVGEEGTKLIRTAHQFAIGYFDGTDEPLETALANTTALSCFAVIKDGCWYERGDMGWWGIVIDGEDMATWNAKIAELVRDADPELMVSVVDCHI